jgi:hypothetical protein
MDRRVFWGALSAAVLFDPAMALRDSARGTVTESDDTEKKPGFEPGLFLPHADSAEKGFWRGPRATLKRHFVTSITETVAQT